MTAWNLFFAIEGDGNMKQHLCIFKLIGILLLSVVLIGISSGHSASDRESFSLEDVLSPPYPWNLVSAKSADRIAWVFYHKGERNVWTAASPDFKPRNLTGFGKDEVFEIPDAVSYTHLRAHET